MKQLDKYSVILWDFDGVILDSMSIRDLGFVKVLEREGFTADKISLLLNYHRENGGLSRYVKFRYFYEQILGQHITDLEILKLSNAFSSIMLDLLMEENLLILDSLNFIKKNFERFNFHIVSGSDQVELRKICKGLNIEKYFKSIEGSPTAKCKLISDVKSKYCYVNKDICLIGDSINDYDAANKNNIDFFGYNNSSLKKKGDYISNFSKL